MKRLLMPLGLALALCAPLPATAQTAPPSTASPDPAATLARQYTLSNGMTLIVRPDRRAPTAVHMLWVRVGSMDEVDGTSGVAHALEHMMFKGSALLKPGEFSQRVSALGGQLNAFTSRDNTAYHEQVPADRLEEVMRLGADRFATNRWSDDEFAREMSVIKEERRQRTEESPRARMYEAFNAMVWQASPYRRPIIGWMSDLDAMTPQDARDFHRRWYVPANAAVVITGDVDVQRVREWAERYYGRIPAAAVPERKPRTEPPQQGPRRLEYRGVTEQPLVTLAWHAPRYSGRDDEASRDALALAVLSGLLDGYPGARLDRALVQGEGNAGKRVADSASAGYGLIGRGPQVFTLSAVPARGVTPEMAAAALKLEVERIAREGVSEAELQRVKTQWTASEVYKLDSIMGQAQELGTYWVNGLPVDAGERLIAQLRAVTAEQVRAVAGRYFIERTLNTGVLLPEARNGEGAR
ncbi:MAG: insulinase family protein [Hydrogenophaga sp.]|uniref:Insulinase family protein n=1 Tax=Hydrogenophaga crocea TaxID=2716225 RepID=A0A6G8IHU6_9BURK|nr:MULTISPECIES: pitrilysin family protein [Hydrogenophaga]MBL0946341.1 insulinase family protein [Hydrogenophaga sp.]QIM52711.1 insulinase family protein [Hydrogenophaga crocea]